MKITDLEVRYIPRDAAASSALVGSQGGGLDYVLVRVLTDEGIDGFGMAWPGRSPRANGLQIVHVLKDLLQGANPLDREQLWQRARTIDRKWGLLPMWAYGPVDVALWDIAGKLTGLPVHRLLGSYRGEVPAYASSMYHDDAQAYVDEALACRELGYRGYKLHPPGSVPNDLTAYRLVREAVGGDFLLMADPVATYDLVQAKRVGRALEELDYYWFEEPIDDTNLYGYRELARTLSIPIAAGESLGGGFAALSAYLMEAAVDILRADVSWKGGITGLTKAAHLCEAFGIRCEIHTAVTPIMEMANLHVACAVSNCEFVEYLFPTDLFGSDLAMPPSPNSAGLVQAPEDPGIGGAIDLVGLWSAGERVS